MSYRFNPLRVAFRLLAPALRSPQRKAGTPQYIPRAGAHTGHSETTVDSEGETTGQASAEVSATFLPRELQVVINAIESGFQSLRGDLVELRGDIVDLGVEFHAFRYSQLRVSGQVLQSLSTISDCLGIRCDGFNAAWLQRMLAARGHPDAMVERRVMVADPERTVHSHASTVEIDLFCRDPLVIVEATTFLGEQELDKVHKFARLGALIAKREGKFPEMLFCTFGVHPSISSSVAKFCIENNIDLFTDNVER
jgi:hypothetical protein